MLRREFLATTGVFGASLATGTATTFAQTFSAKHQFQLKYAPHFGMFKALGGDDPIDQLKFAADQGFTAWEDNGMPGRPVEMQEKIGQTMADLGMTMGVFVANNVSWGKPDLASGKQESRDNFLKSIRDSVDIAKRVNAKWMTVVPGHVDNKLQMDYQTANVIESLRQASAILEPHKLVMVLEPLNWWANHAGQFLVTTPQAYLICKAVNSPSCKILFDIYHQQISEGNLIPNIDKAWDEIAYFQVGDNPGRKEPGTGEINYRNVFRHIHDKGFTGVVGMEHGNSKDGAKGEQAVIDSYVKADDF
ncbi:hydroxypyruvate isomerase family protein [Bythopirellula goksoeyrii]|uniref:Hydroxypyruvate isomerase n=1 Tax=Bythopirellula goksoeyrii TaxID=1400387 RepID=A0A5B9Q4X7_9BACT|nr:TIM barrel protein [Bythopirellula goksoeyrii]QEG34088.1 Hydroxypyruvate isomerase [Bythopirellula goksoeyrii]